MSPYLDPAEEHYIGGFVDHLINETSEQITRLSAYLDRGKAEVDKNLPAPFETFYRNTHALAEFMTAMWSLSYAPSKELAVLADLVQDLRGSFEDDLAVAVCVLVDRDRDAPVVAEVGEELRVLARGDQDLAVFVDEPHRDHARRAVGTHGGDAREMAAFGEKLLDFLFRKLRHLLVSLSQAIAA